MRAGATAILLAMILALAACQGSAVSDPRREEAAIRASDARWLAAARAHDLEQTLAYWTQDAIIMQPGSPAIVGKAAIRAYVSGAFALPDFSIQWVTDKVHVAKSGDLAYSTGSDQISLTTPDGKRVIEHNNSAVVWRKEPDGSWKVVLDMWNPAESAPESTAH